MTESDEPPRIVAPDSVSSAIGRSEENGDLHIMKIDWEDKKLLYLDSDGVWVEVVNKWEPKFKVKIVITTTGYIEVDASSEQEAEAKAEKKTLSVDDLDVEEEETTVESVELMEDE